MIGKWATKPWVTTHRTSKQKVKREEDKARQPRKVIIVVRIVVVGVQIIAK